MSQPTTKKKPDFKKLDLSKVVATNNPTAIPAPIVGLEKPGVSEGYWIKGKNNKDVSPSEFKVWLKELLPGMDVDKWELDNITTPSDREKVILRIVDLFKLISLRVENKKEKKYLN